MIRNLYLDSFLIALLEAALAIGNWTFFAELNLDISRCRVLLPSLLSCCRLHTFERFPSLTSLASVSLGVHRTPHKVCMSPLFVSGKPAAAPQQAEAQCGGRPSPRGRGIIICIVCVPQASASQASYLYILLMHFGMTELWLLLTAAVASYAPTSRYREFTSVEKANVTKLICRSAPSQFQEITAGRSVLPSFFSIPFLLSVPLY